MHTAAWGSLQRRVHNTNRSSLFRRELEQPGAAGRDSLQKLQRTSLGDLCSHMHCLRRKHRGSVEFSACLKAALDIMLTRAGLTPNIILMSPWRNNPSYSYDKMITNWIQTQQKQHNTICQSCRKCSLIVTVPTFIPFAFFRESFRSHKKQTGEAMKDLKINQIQFENHVYWMLTGSYGIPGAFYD